jgi:nucleotide-binding universal stress UspA family protein
MFQRLLICTDFCDGLQRLVNFVPTLAAAGIRHLTFLHCVPLDEGGAIPRVDTDKVHQAQEKLGVATRNLPDGISVEVVVESGRPSDLILKVAQAHQVELILLGLVTQNLVTEKLFGSTTRVIYERTKIPILVVRTQLISTYTTEELDLRCRHIFRHLMVPYDGSDAAKRVIQSIKELVPAFTPPVVEACTVCQVLESTERWNVSRQPYIEAAEATLALVKAELAPLNLQVDTQVRLGGAVSELLRACLEPDVSAIAVSHNRRNRLLEMSIPSFTVELLRQSWHPVLYFPPTDAPTG